MHSSNLNGLLELVRGGDTAAADELRRLLDIAVGQSVRRMLRTEDYASALGRRVAGLLGDAAVRTRAGDTLEATAERITEAVCGQTVARLRSEGRSAWDTVLA